MENFHEPSVGDSAGLGEWHTHGAAQNRRGNLRATSHILGAPSSSPYRAKATLFMGLQTRWVRNELFCARNAFAFERISAISPIRDAAWIVRHILKAMLDELVIDENTRCTTGIGAVDDQFCLGLSVFKKVLSKRIEPGIRFSRNIHSSKQLTSIKLSLRSSFSFSSSRVMVFIRLATAP